MNEQSLCKKFYYFILRTRTMILINILTGIGLIFFVLLLFLPREGSYIQGIFLLLFSLFIGLS
jgi:hypothetical protein